MIFKYTNAKCELIKTFDIVHINRTYLLFGMTVCTNRKIDIKPLLKSKSQSHAYRIDKSIAIP